MSDGAETIELRDDDGALAKAFIESVRSAIETGNADDIQKWIGDLHEADMADVLELLAPDQRASLINLLGRDLDYAVLSELDEAVS